MDTEHLPISQTGPWGIPSLPPQTVAKDIESLARQLGVVPIDDPDVLRGDFWPEEELLDDFLVSLRASRRE
jgi:hypothetical protein